MEETFSPASNTKLQQHKSLPVRKLDLTSIFIGAFNIYRLHFVPLAMLFILIYPPAMIFSARFTSKVYHVLMEIKDIESLSTIYLPFTPSEIVSFLLSALTIVTYLLLVYPIILIAPPRLAGSLYLGRETTVLECVRFALRKWWLTQSSYFFFGVLVIGAFTVPLLFVYLGFIPGLEVIAIFISLGLVLLASMVTIALVFLIAPMNGIIAFEKVPSRIISAGIRNVRRAFSLSFANFWYIVALLNLTWFLMTLIRYIIATPISMALILMGYYFEHGRIGLEAFLLRPSEMPLWVYSTSQSLNAVISTLTLPIEQIVLGLLYFDLRGKQESVDILANTSLIMGEDPLLAISIAPD